MVYQNCVEKKEEEEEDEDEERRSEEKNILRPLSLLSLFSSPPPKLLVQPPRVVPHPLRQLRSAQDTFDPVHGDAVDEQQQCRERADAEAGRQGGIGVRVDLDYLDVSRHAVGAVLIGWRERNEEKRGGQQTARKKPKEKEPCFSSLSSFFSLSPIKNNNSCSLSLP